MNKPNMKPKDDLENLKQITSSSLTENPFSIKSSFKYNLPLRKTGLVIMPKPKNDAVVSRTNDDMKFSPDTDYKIDEAVEIFTNFTMILELFEIFDEKGSNCFCRPIHMFC